MDSENLLNILCNDDIKINELNNKEAIFIINKRNSLISDTISNIFLNQLLNYRNDFTINK